MDENTNKRGAALPALLATPLGDDRTIYVTDDLELIQHIHQIVLDTYKRGLGPACICAELGISLSTFQSWRKKHPQFKKVCEMGVTYSVAYWDRLGTTGMQQKNFNERHYKNMTCNKHSEYFCESQRPTLQGLRACKTAHEAGTAVMLCLANGEITPDEALKISQCFTNLANLKEKTELEGRLIELEKKSRK